MRCSLVDKVMKFRGGDMKIERVMNVYMKAWVISHPRRSAEQNVRFVRLVTQFPFQTNVGLELKLIISSVSLLSSYLFVSN